MGGENQKEKKAREQQNQLKQIQNVIMTVLKLLEKEQTQRQEAFIKYFYDQQLKLSNGELRIKNFILKADQIQNCNQIRHYIQNSIAPDSTVRKQYNIMLFGGAQMGKSSLINFLLQKNKAKIGNGFFSQTQQFNRYSGAFFDKNSVINFVDTPGLFDNSSDGQNDNLQILTSVYTYFICYFQKNLPQTIDLFFIVQKQAPEREVYIKFVVEVIAAIFGLPSLARACLILTNEDQVQDVLKEGTKKQATEMLRLKDQIESQSQVFNNQTVRVKNKTCWESEQKKQEERCSTFFKIQTLLKSVENSPVLEVYSQLFKDSLQPCQQLLGNLKTQYSSYEKLCLQNKKIQKYVLDEDCVDNLCWVTTISQKIESVVLDLNKKLIKMQITNE